MTCLGLSSKDHRRNRDFEYRFDSLHVANVLGGSVRTSRVPDSDSRSRVGM